MSGNHTYSCPVSPRSRRDPERRGRFVTDVEDLAVLSRQERERLQAVTERYRFRASEHYLELIDWSDSADPLRRIIVPCEDELVDFGSLDASNEASNTVVPGMQHKYADTALLLCIETCGGYCRYCFRKRLFIPGVREVTRDLGPAFDYVRAHPEITDVLLTGGDPLLLPASRLAAIVRQLRQIPHVRTVRIGTKMLAFDPRRFLEDEELHALLAEQSGPYGRVHLMCHFDHPRELSKLALEAIDLALSLGVVCANQCPVIAGVNDDRAVLAELFEATTSAGCPQYYLFQGRPTQGNAPFLVPIVRGWELFSEARSEVSGLARRARFCMSHASGKIEVVGVDDEHIFLRYHRARSPEDHDRVIVCERDDAAVWFDDLIVSG